MNFILLLPEHRGIIARRETATISARNLQPKTEINEKFTSKIRNFVLYKECGGRHLVAHRALHVQSGVEGRQLVAHRALHVQSGVEGRQLVAHRALHVQSGVERRQFQPFICSSYLLHAADSLRS